MTPDSFSENDRLAVPALERIDSICLRFEAAWGSPAQRPQIEELLTKVPEAERTHLLRELLSLELEFRRRDGDRPSIVEFQTRFPTYTKVVAEVFRESDSPSRCSGFAAGDVINERYELRHVLGEGGMAVVFRAHDRAEDHFVALKLMRTALTGTARKRFAREFRSVASVDHPNCIKVYDFGEASGVPYFTMELFEGQPITELSALPLPVILNTLREAASAIDHMHSQGIVHRDLKPSNLLIKVNADTSGGTPQVDLKITDFGLARYFGTPSSISLDSGFIGTLAYCAPEQIDNREVDHRADLYSLGMVSYELLTGRYPFPEARDAGTQSLIHAQLVSYPAPSHQYNPEIPAEVEKVITALLSKEARDRPASASLLATAISFPDKAEAAAGALTQSPNAVARPADRFVGRSPQLAEGNRILRNALSPFHRSQREWTTPPLISVLFITGAAGIGKSRFLRELVGTARRQGAMVFEGRCFEANLTSYQPFVEILRQILWWLRPSPRMGANVLRSGQLANRIGTTENPAIHFETASPRNSKDALWQVVEDHSPELLRVAPDLRRYLPGKAFRQGDLSREAKYILRAVASFFIDIGKLHGTCLCIEDIQWADASTLDLLKHLAWAVFRSRELSLEGNLTFPRLLVCCTARSEYSAVEKLIQELRSDRYSSAIELQALTVDEVRELSALFLNSPAETVTEPLIKTLQQRSQGNPFFISECVRAWCEESRIVQVDKIWQLAVSSDESPDWPDSVRDLLRTRLQDLSPAAGRVLTACAVIGSVIDTDLLREAVPDVSENELFDAIDELLSGKILVESGTTRQLEFSHDLLRELTYGELTNSRRRALHRRIGETMEKRAAGHRSLQPELLAGHFRAAEVAEKAFTYLLDAGEAALQSYAVDDAIRHLQTAETLVGEPGFTGDRSRLYELLANALKAAGRAADAIVYYMHLLEIATDPVQHARILERIGELQFRIGEFDTAVSFFDRALREVGYPRPRSLLFAAASTVASYARDLWPRWLNFRRSLKGTNREKAIVASDAYTGLDYLWAQRNVIRCAHAGGRQMVLANRIGDVEYLAHAAARKALVLGIFSVNPIALRSCRRALAYASETGDSEIMAIAQGHVGCVHYYGAKLDEAERLLRLSLEVLDRRGDSWYRMFFYHNLRHLYAVRGDTENELACAEAEMQIGDAAGDPEGTCWGAYGMANALARSGRLPEAYEYLQRSLDIISGRTNIIVFPTALQTSGFVHMQSGDTKSAIVALEEAREVVESSWAFVDYSIRLYALLAECILGPQWLVASKELGPEDRRRGYRLARRAHSWGRRFPNYLPHSLRVRGRAAFVRGQRKKAIAYFGNAIEAARSIGARYDLARSHIDLASVLREAGGEHEQKGHEILDEIGACLPAAER